MLKDLKEMEQIYCLEIPKKGIPVRIHFFHGDLKISYPKGDISCLFDVEKIKETLAAFCVNNIEIVGKIHGPELQFSSFDVKLNNDWISVPMAKALTDFLKLNFVKYYQATPSEVEFVSNVILRPMQECVDENGVRIIEEIQ